MVIIKKSINSPEKTTFALFAHYKKKKRKEKNT